MSKEQEALQYDEIQTSPHVQAAGLTPHLGPPVVMREPGTSQHGELDQDNWQVRDSKYHKHLKSKGYKYTGSGNGSWTHYYEHPDGAKARIEFNHSNDTHGTMHKGHE